MMFLCEFWEILKNIFLPEKPSVAASQLPQKNLLTNLAWLDRPVLSRTPCSNYCSNRLKTI